LGERNYFWIKGKVIPAFQTKGGEERLSWTYFINPIQLFLNQELTFILPRLLKKGNQFIPRLFKFITLGKVNFPFPFGLERIGETNPLIG